MSETRVSDSEFIERMSPLVAHGPCLILCDIWGVVHNGRKPFPKAIEALRSLREERHNVLLISNAPRPSRIIPAQFELLGVATDVYDGIVTSGDIACDIVRERSSAGTPKVFHLGPGRDDALFEDISVERTALDEAEFVLCTGLFEEEQDETPERYDDLLRNMVARGLDMICANPDLVVQAGDKLIYCAGSLAKRFEEFGGQVTYTGKPSDLIYKKCFEISEAMTGRPVDPPQVLAIGDGLKTDIRGAAGMGLTSIFVVGGIHGAEVCEADGSYDPERLAPLVATVGAAPDYVMDKLVY